MCHHCDEAIPYTKRRNRFCGHSCAASVANKGVFRNFKHGEFSEKPCENCGLTTNNKRFCSRLCDSENNWKQNLEAIENSGCLIGSNPLYGYSPLIARKYLIYSRGHCCSICLNCEWMGGKIPLVLDHVNGDPADHRLENVRMVCGNCNMLLPTFAGRNRGYGRKNRK